MDNITAIWNEVTSNIPDVILAILVLILAFICAALAKALIAKSMKWLGVERLLAKANMDQKNITKTTAFVSKLVQLVVFALFLPGIFEKLGLNNIATPIIAMVSQFTEIIPTFIAAAVLLIVGGFIGKQLSVLLEQVLVTAGLDKKTDKLLEVTGTKVNGKFSLAKIVAEIANVAVVIFVAIEACSLLGLEVLTRIGNKIVDYAPYALSAVLIMGIAILVANWVEKNIVTKFSDSKTMAFILKTVIVTVGVFIMLSQLGVATTLVNSAFMIILGALGVAFAVAFGLGGREFAAHTLRKIEGKIDKKR